MLSQKMHNVLNRIFVFMSFFFCAILKVLYAVSKRLTKLKQKLKSGQIYMKGAETNENQFSDFRNFHFFEIWSFCTQNWSFFGDL